MVSDFVEQLEVSNGMVPTLELEKFYSEFPWGKTGLSDEQKQLLLLTEQYLDLVELGKKIVNDIVVRRVIKLNPSAVEAYMYFYRAFKLSALSQKYRIDEFLLRMRGTLNQLSELAGKQPPTTMKSDVDEIHQLFDLLTAQTGTL
jgi:hypothetical protein